MEYNYINSEGLKRLIENNKNLFSKKSHTHATSDIVELDNILNSLIEQIKYVDTLGCKAWIVSSNGNILLSSDSSTLTCKVIKGDNNIDTDGSLYMYSWRRYINGVMDNTWIKTGKSINVNGTDFTESITYVCEVMQLYALQDESRNLIVDESGNIIVGYCPFIIAEINLSRNFNETVNNYIKTTQIPELNDIGDGTIVGAIKTLKDCIVKLQNS